MSLESQEDTPKFLNSSEPETICQLSDIGLTFQSGNRELEVLRNINLELKLGDFVCVLGSSGCGKTSLLRVLAGYQPPTLGSVTVSGKPHTKPGPEVGVVFQRPNLFPWLTIAKNVEFGPKMRGVPKLERKKLVSYYLKMVKLVDAAHLLPHQISGGMKQRGAIARTLAADPKLILMDEPFGALDALTRESMQSHLQGIWERTQKTIFFITHDVEEALLLSTRIAIMHPRPGRIVQIVDNPFVHALKDRSAAQLRVTPEFVQMREQLVASI